MSQRAGSAHHPFLTPKAFLRIEFDFADVVRSSPVTGETHPAGAAHRCRVLRACHLGPEPSEIPVTITELPSEIPGAIPFSQDRIHCAFRPRLTPNSFWRALVQIDRVLKQFRTGFIGKVSPVHFFLGQLRSCRNAVLRGTSAATSGRRAWSFRCGHARGLFA